MLLHPTPTRRRRLIIAWLNFLVLVIAAFFVPYLYIKSVQPGVSEYKIGEEAWLRGARYRQITTIALRPGLSRLQAVRGIPPALGGKRLVASFQTLCYPIHVAPFYMRDASERSEPTLHLREPGHTLADAIALVWQS